jgi:hypothetical protein
VIRVLLAMSSKSTLPLLRGDDLSELGFSEQEILSISGAGRILALICHRLNFVNILLY